MGSLSSAGVLYGFTIRDLMIIYYVPSSPDADPIEVSLKPSFCNIHFSKKVGELLALATR